MTYFDPEENNETLTISLGIIALTVIAIRGIAVGAEMEDATVVVAFAGLGVSIAGIVGLLFLKNKKPPEDGENKK